MLVAWTLPSRHSDRCHWKAADRTQHIGPQTDRNARISQSARVVGVRSAWAVAAMVNRPAGWSVP